MPATIFKPPKNLKTLEWGTENLGMEEACELCLSTVALPCLGGTQRGEITPWASGN